jgi:hypothetical protein
MALAPAPHQTGTGGAAEVRYDTLALSVHDFLRGRGDGRLLRYRPPVTSPDGVRRPASTQVLLGGLYFANGVALGPNDVRWPAVGRGGGGQGGMRLSAGRP